MGIFDGVLDGFNIDLPGRARRSRHERTGQRLLEEGTPGRGAIVGIRVHAVGEHGTDKHDFAIAFDGGRAGCRQALGPLVRQIRLGLEVPVRHDGERVIIDAPALGAEDEGFWHYRPLGDPPADGIVDGNVDLVKERRKAAEAQVTVLDAQRSVVLGMPVANVDLHVRVERPGEPPYETVVKRVDVPFYASHLATPGAEVVGLVRPDKPERVRIDWCASAMAVPGLDQPTAEVLTARTADEVVGDDAEADWSPVGLAADEHGVEGGIGFAAWVEIEAGLVRDRVPPRDHDTYAQGFGVPAGEWAAAQGAWHARMMRDPRVGAAFGHAYQQALKRR